MKLQRKPLFERLEEGFQAAISHAEGKRSLRETWVPAVAPPHSRSAEEILRLREGLGLTQETLAKFLSVSVTSLNAWEKGQRKPSGSVLRLLQILEGVDKSTLWALLKPPTSKQSSAAPRRKQSASQ